MSEGGRVSELERLAHELVSPVSALVALAEAARDPGRSVPATRLLHMAVAAGRDVERLLADPSLRRYAREEVALEEVLLPLSLGRERVVVELEPGLRVAGDPTRLRQAVGNLVANGLRHGSAVRVSAVGRDGKVLVDVADDGPGVDPAIDPFAEGVSGAGSTGLGLAIARRVAEAHGGSLELVPTASGACFRLALPSSAGAS